MEALLASPASYSSPESNASSGFDSPRLPDLESPVRFGQHDIFTPSSAASATTQEIPAWLSEDLEEEWVEREASDSFDMTRSPVIESIRTYASSSSASSQRYNSVKPRQPSTLRHVMSNSSLQNTDPSENGSVVVKSFEPVNLKSPAQPSQLEVAARAMRGDRGGLGSPAVRSVSQKLNLLKLFDPPSPSSGESTRFSQAVDPLGSHYGSISIARIANCRAVQGDVRLYADQVGPASHRRSHTESCRVARLLLWGDTNESPC